MKLRAHRRNLVAWSPSTGPADRYGASGLTRLARTRRIHRFIRTGALLRQQYFVTEGLLAQVRRMTA